MVLPVAQFTDPWLSQPIKEAPWLTGIQKGVGLAGQLQKMREEAKLAPLTREKTAATTGLTKEQTKMLPLETAIKAGTLGQSQSRFGPGYTAARLFLGMPAAQRAQVFAEDPKKYLALYQNLMNQALVKPTPGAPGGTGDITQRIISGELQKAFPQYAGAPQTSVSPSAASQPGMQPGAGTPAMPVIPSLAQQYQEQQKGNQAPRTQPTPHGMPIIPPGTTLPPPMLQQYPPGSQAPGAQPPGAPFSPQYTSEQMQHIKNNVSLAAVQKITPAATNARATSAAILDNWVNNNRVTYSKRINNALEYAGAWGKGKRYFQSWSNKNPDKLSDYDWYTKTFRTILGNNQRLMEKMGATDQQVKDQKEMLSEADSILSNPKRAKMTINKMMRTWQEQSESIYTGAEPFSYKGIYRRAYNITPYKGDYLGGGAPIRMTKVGKAAPKAGQRNIGKLSDAELQRIIARGKSK